MIVDIVKYDYMDIAHHWQLYRKTPPTGFEPVLPP
jgi:hypothetical protein